jgi:hypothetical protein
MKRCLVVHIMRKTATLQGQAIARGDRRVKVRLFWRERWAFIGEVLPRAASKVYSRNV